MRNIGIMQGRLVPPTEDRIQCFPCDRWQDEFALAAQANLGCIEWIHDQYGADVNPIATDAGVAQMKSLVQSSGVKIFLFAQILLWTCHCYELPIWNWTRGLFYSSG